MNAVRNIALLAAAAALASIIWHALDSSPGSTPAATSPPRWTTGTWRGLDVPLPRGWRRLESEDDIAVWASKGRRRTVTVTSAPRSQASLERVAQQVADALPVELAGTRVRRVMALRATRGAAVAIDFEVVRTGRRLRCRQIWRRLPDTPRDAVTTWTSADEDWPLPRRAARAISGGGVGSTA